MNTVTHYVNGRPRPVPTIQLDKISRVLKRDADAHRLIAGQLMIRPNGPLSRASATCQSAGRCAIGSLLWALPSVPVLHLTTYGNYNLPKLRREYGLLELHVDAIVATNDGTPDAENNGKRYEEVMALVTFAEWAQRQGVRFDGNIALLHAYRTGNFDV